MPLTSRRGNVDVDPPEREFEEAAERSGRQLDVRLRRTFLVTSQVFLPS